MVVKSDGQSESFLFPLEMLRGARSLASIVCPNTGISCSAAARRLSEWSNFRAQEVEGAKCLPLPG